MKTPVVRVFTIFTVVAIGFIAINTLLEARGFDLIEYVWSVMLTIVLLTVACIILGLVFGAGSTFADGMSAAFLAWKLVMVLLIILAILEPALIIGITQSLR